MIFRGIIDDIDDCTNYAVITLKSKRGSCEVIAQIAHVFKKYGSSSYYKTDNNRNFYLRNDNELITHLTIDDCILPITPSDKIYCNLDKDEHDKYWTCSQYPIIRVDYSQDKIKAFVRQYQTRPNDEYAHLLEGKLISSLFLSNVNKVISRSEFFSKLNIPKYTYKYRTKINNWRLFLMSWNDFFDARQLYLLGLDQDEIRKLSIRHVLKKSKYNIIQRLLDDPIKVPEISIDRAKIVADLLGITHHKYEYIESKIYRQLYDQTIDCAVSIIPTSVHKIERFLENYPKVIYKYDVFFMKKMYDYETHLSQRFMEIITSATKTHESDPNYIMHYKDILTESQRQAIKNAVYDKISIIHGRAGTGKTTLLKSLIKTLNANEKTHIIASFMGKAVQRCLEVMNKLKANAMTLHSFYYGPHESPDYLIIDESSTLYYELVKMFLKKVHINTHIVFIGNTDQIPPMHNGRFFEQLIKYAERTKSINITHLDITHRSSGTLLSNANYLLDTDDFDEFEESDSFIVTNLPGRKYEERTEYMSKQDLSEMKVIKKRVKWRKDSGVPIEDIKIITPMNKHTSYINTLVWNIYNNDNMDNTDWSKNPVTMAPKIVKEGMRVMMLVNCNDAGLMNGQEGVIVKCKPDSIIVNFKDKEYEFLHQNGVIDDQDDDDDEADSKDLIVKNLRLSYCLTVHKSQGSEYNDCMYYIPYNSRAVNKNAVYTAMTRAKKRFEIIGNEHVIRAACNKSLEDTGEYLCERMCELNMSV